MQQNVIGPLAVAVPVACGVDATHEPPDVVAEYAPAPPGSQPDRPLLPVDVEHDPLLYVIQVPPQDTPDAPPQVHEAHPRESLTPSYATSLLP